MNRQAVSALKSGALYTTGAACFGAIVGAIQGGYGGAFIATCTDVTFHDGVATGAKWTALVWAAAITAIGSYMTLQSLKQTIR